MHPPVCTHTHTQTHTYTNIAHYILILYKSELRNTLTGGVSIAVNPNGTTSITVSWMVISSITTSGYIISYCNIDNTRCFTTSNTTSIAGSLSSYIIEDLQEATQYSITVSILGRSDQDTAEATTMAACMSINESTLHCVYYLGVL